jgi:hypothetical protein
MLSAELTKSYKDMAAQDRLIFHYLQYNFTDNIAKYTTFKQEIKIKHDEKDIFKQVT